MAKALLSFLTVLSCFLVTGACGASNDAKSDNSGVKTDQRKVDSFSSLQVSGHGDIVVSVQEAGSVSITDNEKYLAGISTSVKEDVLQISVPENLGSAPKITVGVPKLDNIDVTGAWKMKIEDIKTPALKISVDGATNMICSGSCDDLVAELSGASELAAKELKTKTCTLNLEGACKVKVYVKNSLKLDASGACRVDVDGNPEVTKNVSDAASLTINGESGD